MRPTRVTAAVAAALALVGLAACAPATTDSSPRATVSGAPASATPTLPAAPEDPRPAVVWPLTGLDATTASEADLDRVALSIKIENTDAARPQRALDQADIVFEEYVEYGISRLVAVFHSEYPESVGPIRSMRPMDKNIMGSLGGPLVFSGAQDRFIADAKRAGVTLITEDLGSSGFYRLSGRRAPHNLYGDPDTFAAQASGLPAPTAQWDYAYPSEGATAQVEGSPASRLDLFLSGRAQPEWRWDSGSDRWMRYEDTIPHVTDEGEQLSATNVVMLWVKVRYTDANGGEAVPETLLAGESGSGYVASGDHVVEIEWSKADRTAPFVLTTEAGDPVTLMPGQTWVELVPNAGVGHSTAIDIS